MNTKTIPKYNHQHNDTQYFTLKYFDKYGYIKYEKCKIGPYGNIIPINNYNIETKKENKENKIINEKNHDYYEIESDSDSDI